MLPLVSHGSLLVARKFFETPKDRVDGVSGEHSVLDTLLASLKRTVLFAFSKCGFLVPRVIWVVRSFFPETLFNR